MSQIGNNPLAKHFRQPVIYLKLPGGGKYWREGTLDLPITGELPIYPMTTRDEITLRTPDALLNGQGVVDVIQSCCPNIKNAWAMPNNESDSLLIAMRIASYGSEMSVNSKCPHCSEENIYDIDLNVVLDRIKFPNYDKTLEDNGLVFKFRPQTYETANKTSLAAFEEQRLLAVLLQDDDNEESKLAEFNKRLKRITELNVELLAESVDYIETENGEKVQNLKYIKEFFDNAKASTVKAVQKQVEDLNKESQLPSVRVTCNSCSKEYDLTIEFNFSSFFAQGS
jgi:hypothetical protein